jgi:hypothetical protein
MLTFRKFAEDMTAPTMGSEGAPTSPETKNYNGDVADRERGISPDVRDNIDIHGEMLRSDKPLQIPGHPELNSAPVFLQIIKKYPNGGARVRIMSSLSNQEKRILPNNGDPLHLRTLDGDKDGPEIYLNQQTIDQIRYGSFDKPGGEGGMGAIPPPPGPGTPMPGAM